MQRFFTALFFLTIFCSGAQAEPRRELFVSVIQDPPVLSSRAQIDDLVSFSKTSGVRTLFVQVYRANRSWFRSSVSDNSPYEAGLKSLSEDPFALLIRKAHAEGIEVHAWLNLMSLSANAEAPILKKYGPGVLTRNREPKTSLADYKIDNQFFLEPGDPRVRGLLSKVVDEVLTGYPELDGIQFDYIRYPDVHPAYGHSPIVEERFKKATGLSAEEGSEAWNDWKRSQVTTLLKRLVRRAKTLRPDIQVSATGLTPYVRAYAEAEQDWMLWANSGIVDFVTLMCYSNDAAQFEKYLSDGSRRITDPERMNIAIGAYKFLDEPAGFGKQFDLCESGSFRSCVTLHYGDLLQNPALKQPFGKTRPR